MEILQRYANFLFWVLWACLVGHTQNDQINMYKTLMFICMQKTNFIIHFFLEILHFKESCNLIDSQHREQEFCQIWDWSWNINSISFHVRFYTRKTNDKIFLKIQKEHIFGPFWTLFTQIWAKMSVFRYSNYLSLRQKLEKTMEQFLRKTPNWQTDRQTDDGDFTRPSVASFWGSSV